MWKYTGSPLGLGRRTLNSKPEVPKGDFTYKIEQLYQLSKSCFVRKMQAVATSAKQFNVKITPIFQVLLEASRKSRKSRPSWHNPSQVNQPWLALSLQMRRSLIGEVEAIALKPSFWISNYWSCSLLYLYRDTTRESTTEITAGLHRDCARH
jgi:hypothetical protein